MVLAVKSVGQQDGAGCKECRAAGNASVVFGLLLPRGT